MKSVVRLVAILVGLLVALQAGPVEAKRVVLVIGNAEYKVGPLDNPVNDAVAIAEIFKKQLKFDKVILKKNLGAVAFREALLEFSRDVTGAEVAAVYFAGHGAEDNGKNFLIPTDARLARASDLSLEAIPLDTVLDQLAGAARLKLVILDACRNNPYDVVAVTSREQQPHVYGSLGAKEFYLLPPLQAPTSAGVEKQEDLASLKAELDRLKAEAVARPAAPVDSKPAEEMAKLKATITRLELEVKRLEARPPASPGAVPPSPAKKPARQARPHPTEYSLKIWARGSLKLGQTVTADTPHGPLTCTSQGPPSGGYASRPCRWGR